ncbi:MAG TPA: DUF2911 domain-containing protein [Patescibacteria group bacterium]|nr:DUF2911 domain-containing protein [Patescibacteria group bacterium]
MRKLFAMFGVALLGLAVWVAPGMARQFGGERRSPPAKASCRFADGKIITVEYSSPRVRGRKIFGDLVPYGQVWILGANQATTFDTTANLTADGKPIPAGKYTLFAIPNPDSWTLIVNKTSRDAIGFMSYYPGKSSDLARLSMSISKLPSKREDFTISLVPGGSACTMRFDWDLTRASLVVRERK